MLSCFSRSTCYSGMLRSLKWQCKLDFQIANTTSCSAKRLSTAPCENIRIIRTITNASSRKMFSVLDDSNIMTLWRTRQHGAWSDLNKFGNSWWITFSCSLPTDLSLASVVSPPGRSTEPSIDRRLGLYTVQERYLD
jgi:hypothetical protein